MDDVKEMLDRIEAELAEVKRQYDLFFQGGRRAEPAQERRNLEGLVRRMGQRKIVNTSDQFRFTGLQSRFYSLANLWTRTVRDMEEGRLERDKAGALVRPAQAEPGYVDPAHLDAVALELRDARRACGLSAGDEEIAVIRETLRERAREIASRSGARAVEFKVSIEDGRPKVRAVAH